MRTHFDIDIIGNDLLHFRIHGYGNIELDRKELIIDPSVLHFLLFDKVKDNDFIFYLPDTLIRLIDKSKESEEHRMFLERFLNYWGYPYYHQNKKPNWNLFYNNIKTLKIKPITKDTLSTDNEKNNLEFYEKEFKNHSFYIALSPLTNVLADCVGKIVEFSKKTGTMILSKTRRLANLVREKIIALEIPKRMDNIVKAKQNITNKIFNFQGGRATKFFLGLVIAIVSMENSKFNEISVLFAFFDP